MSNLRFLYSLIPLCLLGSAGLSCGSSGGLNSITVTPASADAKNSSNGQVQFTAVGTYAGSGQSVPVKALWWNSEPWFIGPTPANGINIDENGVATCTDLPGTFTVWATAPRNQSIPPSQMKQSTPQLTETAQMTCP
jgi:hypothetical protein